MFRWPYRLRWIDGTFSRIKYLQGIARGTAELWENVWIRLSPLPKRGTHSGSPRAETVTVSLTSFPQRINKAYYAIKSLMLQRVKADRIILWLSDEQFKSQILPAKFKKLTDRGLEIKFVDGDLRSHKKYYYALQQQKPGELVITYDDDIIYDYRSIERLLSTHSRYPECVVCNRASVINFDSEGKLDCDDFRRLYHDEGVSSPSLKLVPSTGAGCLYPPAKMSADTFDLASIFESVPTSDDLWIWFNTMRANVSIIKTRKESATLCSVRGSQVFNLNDHNIEGGGNRQAIAKLEERFPDIMQKYKTGLQQN